MADTTWLPSALIAATDPAWPPQWLLPSQLRTSSLVAPAKDGVAVRGDGNARERAVGGRDLFPVYAKADPGHGADEAGGEEQGSCEEMNTGTCAHG